MTKRSLLTRLGLAFGVASMAVTLSACGPDYQSLPLPGSGVSGDTYELTAVFDQALNLAQGAQVKVNGVPVGRVQSVGVEDFKAKVVMKLKDSAALRRGSTARLRYDTPLGELFIQITPSKTGPMLKDGALLSDADTTTAPTVEDTLASASLLINGGGLGQLQTITTELNKGLGGREATVRDVLRRTNSFLAQANASTADIDAVLNSLAGAFTTLAARQDTINRALREVAPFSKVVRENTDEIVRLLTATDSLSRDAQRVVGLTKRQILQVLAQLDPILQQVLATRPEFVPGLHNLINGTKFVTTNVPGDWVPLQVQVTASGTQVPLPGGGGAVTVPNLPDLPIPGLPGLPSLPVPDLPGLGGLIGGTSTLSNPLGLGGLLGGAK